MSIKIVKGDLIEMAKEGYFDVIMHGCNCFCTMGSGVAKAIREAFPIASVADSKTERGGNKIGTFTLSMWPVYGKQLLIVNAYTQYNYGQTIKQDRFEYRAFESILEQIRLITDGKSIGMPRIGAGLAGGSWERILEIIEEIMHDRDVTIVELR